MKPRPESPARTPRAVLARVRATLTHDGREEWRCRYSGPCNQPMCGRLLLTVSSGTSEQLRREPPTRECPQQASRLLELHAPPPRGRSTAAA
jgi:hypothetical protein